MLTIKVNGRTEKVNIGCQTFVDLDFLLKILEVTPKKVTLNGNSVASGQYALTTVKSDDDLVFL